MDLNEEYVKIISDLIKKSEEGYYNDMESTRRLFLKQKLNMSDHEIDKTENSIKKDLYNWIIKYKDKEKQFKRANNFVNPKHLDLIRTFLKTDKLNLDKLNNQTLSDFKNISENFFKEIPEKHKNQFLENGTSNEKYLFFLQIHEYLKQM